MEQHIAVPHFVSAVCLGMVVALLGTLLLTPVSMMLARVAGVIDYPATRRIHERPTPRWGGMAMCAAFVIAIGLTALFMPGFMDRRITGVLVCAVAMTTLGALDDKYGLSAPQKLLGQIVCATVLVLPWCGVRIEVAWYQHLHPLIGSLATVAWVVLVTNAINLIDGLDGLAAGIACITALTFVIISAVLRGMLAESVLAAAMVGVCLGLLYYNFHPAKVFIGDAGSHFLGVTIAALSILQHVKTPTGITLFVPILALAVPLVDTTFAILRRLYHRQPILAPDKGHLHHRLLSLGWQQKRVVLTIYLLAIIGCGFAFLVALRSVQ